MKLAAFISGLVGLMGCAAMPAAAQSISFPAPDAPPASIAPVSDQDSVDQRAIIGPTLRNILKVTKVTVSTSRWGYLKIQVNVTNVTDSRQKFVYRIEWFDSDGQLLPLITTTSPWMLRPHEASAIAVSAPTPSAKDFGIAFLGGQ